MTLVKARAAFETAIKTAVTAADATVTVVFDNQPFTTPGKTKKYVMVSVAFTPATLQAQGAATDYYSGTITCGVMTPKNKGNAVSSAISESVIDGLISVNDPGYSDTYSVTPRVSRIEGPNSISDEGASHALSVVSCTFTANA